MTAVLEPEVEVEIASWGDVCAFDDLIRDRGVCALVGGRQVAVFRVAPDDEVYALSNHDPFSRANVMSRGIVGSRGDVPKVASPMYKQSFDLRTGQCLDDPAVNIPAYPVRVLDGRVQVCVQTCRP
ncbi:MAG TPA: nitrite reductase small subunit NirD [Acidimicrobiales bacterium]|nr:nitrite reductase small subunit NirD [Acidimicrobiales bacterium]